VKLRELPARLGAAAARSPVRALIITALLIACALPGIGRIQVRGEVWRLIPQRTEASRGLALALEGLTHSDAVYALLEGPADPELLLAVGDDLDAALEASSFVESARSRPSEGLPAIDPLLAIDVADRIAREELAEKLSPDGARRRAAFLKQVLSGPVGREAQEHLLRDPFGLLDVLGPRIARGVQRMDAEQQAFLSPDGSALLIVIRPAEDSADDDFHEALYQELRSRTDPILAAHPRGSELTLGFTGAFMHMREISKATRADASVLSTTSILAVLLLYLLFYRSLTALLLVLAVLPLAALVTLGFGGYVFGELNPLAAGFAAILFGVGVDPAIHLISRYREARLTQPPLEAAMESLDGVAPAVTMAALTTAGALFATALFDPQGMGQMGVLAGVGVLANSALMLFLLPALWILLGDRLAPDAGVGVGLARSFARFLHRRAKPVLAVAAAFGVLVIANWNGLTFDASFDAFQPESMEPVRVDRALRAQFGEAGSKLLILVAGTEEAALLADDRWAERLEQLQADGAIAGFESLSVVRTARSTANQRRAALRAGVDLPGAVEALRQALVELGFRTEPFEPALRRLEWVGVPEDEQPPEALTAPAGGWDPGWTEWFEEKHLARLPDEVRIVTRVFPNAPFQETAQLLREQAPDVGSAKDWVTGISLVEEETEEQFDTGLLPLMVLAAFGLLVVLWTHYRERRAITAGIVPLVYALVLFLCVHSALSIELTVFALAAIPLLIGIGTDDHLFMLDRYLESGKPGRLDDTMASSGRAVLVTTLTTLAAFGVLALSRFDALAGLGRSVAGALALAFISSVVLLPALLTLLLPGEDAPDA